MRYIRWLAVAGLFAVGLGAVAVSTVGLGGTEAATTGYLTATAQRTDIAESSAATGTVAAAATYGLVFGEEASLSGTSATSSTETSWLVDEVLVAVGDRVTAGQELATADTGDVERDLDDATASLELARIEEREAQAALDGMRDELRAQLIDARTAIETARLNLVNAKEQRADAASGTPLRQARIGVITAQDQLRAARRTRDDLAEQLAGDFPDQTIALGQARQAAADLETQVADLTEQLDLARIVSPVDGTVSAVNIRPGLLAPSSDALVVDSATLEVVADVVESDIASMSMGQSAVIGIDAIGAELEGTVTSIAASTDGASGSVVTFPVTVTLADPDTTVKPGMSADVEIVTSRADGVIAVPAVALSGGEGAYTVLVTDAAGGTTPRPVTVGLVTDSFAEVQSGLSEGESVVIGTDTERISSGDGTSLPGPGGFGGAGLGGLAGSGAFRVPPQGGE